LVAKSMFAVCFRNWEATVDTLSSPEVAECVVAAARQLGEGSLSGREGVEVAATRAGLFLLMWDQVSKSVGAVRKVLDTRTTGLTFLMLSLNDHFQRVQRLEQLVPLFIEVMDDEDTVVASMTAFLCSVVLLYSSGAAAAVMQGPELFGAVSVLNRRNTAPRQPAAWWLERCDAVDLPTMCMVGTLNYSMRAAWKYSMLSHEGLREMVLESIHVPCPSTGEISLLEWANSGLICQFS
jgi:hypothetical protein